MHLDAYIRVSKVGGRGGENFLSPDEQRDKITKHAELHNVRLTWHEPELDVSGGTMSRPIFNEVMTRVRAGATDGIIVAKLDRFARTLAGGVKVMAELAERDAVLVSVADNIDLSTPTGRAMGQIMIVFAELERERRKEDWEGGQRAKIARGVHGASPLYGYVKVNGQPLQLDPKTAPTVREMFQLRANGWSCGRIARHLDETAPLDGERRWTARRVRGIVENRAYLGRAYYGELENREAHDPIVTVDEFDAAQVVTGGRNELKGEQGLLAGIVRCAGCRYVMRPRRETRGDKVIPGYVCAKHHGSGECQAPTAIAAHLIDPLVMERLITITRQTEDGGELQEARRTLQLAEDRLRAFTAKIDDFSEMVGETACRAEADDRRGAVEKAQAAVEHVLRTRKQPLPAFDGLGDDDMREAVRGCLDSVYVRKGSEPVPERVILFERGEDELDKPKRGGTDYRLAPVPWDAFKSKTLAGRGDLVSFITEEEMDALEVTQGTRTA
ncbi:MAG TPA: recombinase family protein [Gemmatimonadales bacterium]|nr:recombinase family protein [Gemmatimonadales bacterium]